jgi:methylthioribose-1-phosphate isomerase
MTDPARPVPPAQPVADGPDGDPTGPSTDVGRRLFFRQLAGEMLQGAATIVGMAEMLQRTSAEAARSILEEPGLPAGVAGTSVVGSSGAGAALEGLPRGFRTPFRWEGDRLILIDQRRLPEEIVEVEVRSAAETAQAIRDMTVRGAPAIGQVAAIGLAMAAGRLRASKPYARRATLHGAANALRNARPTAVNLGGAVDRMLARYEALGELSEDGDAIADGMRAEAEAMVFEATADHGRLAELGFVELPETGDRPLNVLTHCNTGPLACGQFGTALGIIQVAHHAGRPVHVYVDETRPYLQGARLTAWELAQAGVPHTLLADVAAGWVLGQGRVDVVLVGADRIAANGDTANKVGTYPLAVLAARHHVPFYVCAPMTSVDLATPDGAGIKVEMRPPAEITRFRGTPLAPRETEALNPAFDVTPAELITGIVTDEGVLRPPYEPALAAAMERSRLRRARPPAVAHAAQHAGEAGANAPGPTPPDDAAAGANDQGAG